MSAVVVPVPSLNPYAADRFVDVPAGKSVREAAAELPFSDAVIVADWLLLTEPAVALNATVDELAATTTEAGAVKTVLLSETRTVKPPVGAACVSVTVQLDVEPAATLLGEHCNAETAGVAD